MAAPAITGLATSVTFNENTVNARGQPLDSAVAFVDADGDFDGGSLTVTGLVSGDVISIRGQGSGAGQISYNSGTGEVSYGGVVIGVATGGVGATFTITFDADATSAAIDALIQTLTYATTSDTPAATRTLTLNVTDAAGEYVGGDDAFTQLTGAANPLNGLDAGTLANAGFADIDGDGDLDLFSGTLSDDLTYFENIGSATAPIFVERTGAANAMNGVSFTSYVAPTFVDIDGDNDLDLFVGEQNGRFRFFRNDGDRNTAAFTEVTGGANPLNMDLGFASKVQFVDLDGDNDLDAVTSNTNAGLQYYLNTGTASTPVFVEQTGGASPFPAFADGRGAPVFIDTDGDGDLDFFLHTASRTILFFENTGTASAPTFVLTSSQFDGLVTDSDASMTGADIDGDGDIDLVLGRFDGAFDYYRFGPTPGIQITVNVTPEADGTAGADSLIGTAAGERLDGFAGDDFLNGKDGDDFLFGAGSNDTLWGGQGSDHLDGGAGADILNGNAGADTMLGGSGDDTYYVDDAGDAVIEGASSGTDTVIATINYTIGGAVENLTLIGAVATGTGNSSDNVLTGSNQANALYGLIGLDTLLGLGGADYLDGGIGADRMEGGPGNDIYVVDNSLDLTIEAADAGRDLVRSSIDWTLAADTEDLTLTGTGDLAGTGNGVANTLVGNTGDNQLRGLGGNDILDGGDGNDVLGGGAGTDRLTGGAGADWFTFTLADADGIDRVLDLSFADGDRIDLSVIDADTGLDGDQAFTFADRFTKVAAQAVLTYDAASNVSLVRLDVDGDGRADITFRIDGDARGGDILDSGSPISDGGWFL
ncbi:MAG: VCBS repeat-containing protein [Caulobacter sp.]|nr:VCBS repeat-containing protein [Caulobacter sp.]